RDIEEGTAIAKADPPAVRLPARHPARPRQDDPVEMIGRGRALEKYEIAGPENILEEIRGGLDGRKGVKAVVAGMCLGPKRGESARTHKAHLIRGGKRLPRQRDVERLFVLLAVGNGADDGNLARSLGRLHEVERRGEGINRSLPVGGKEGDAIGKEDRAHAAFKRGKLAEGSSR